MKLSITKTNSLILFLALISFAVGGVFYDALPAEIASHWNADGVADDTMPKLVGVLLFPVIILAFLGMSLLLPILDPLRKNIDTFRGYYNAFWLVISSLLFYVFVLMIVWNLGNHFNFTQALIPAIAAFVWGLGVLLSHTKRNWMVGIRTPWTLSSDRVWEETHKLGSKLFKASSIILLLSLVLPGSMLLWFLLPLALSALFLVVYSFFLYRTIEQGK